MQDFFFSPEDVYSFIIRAGQINRAMSDARDLLVLLQTAKTRVHQKGDPATLAGLIQKVYLY
jgi:hypothetical protein